MAPKNAKSKADLETTTTLATGPRQDGAGNQPGNQGGAPGDDAGGAQDAGAATETQAAARVDASLNSEGGSPAISAGATAVTGVADPGAGSALGVFVTSPAAEEPAAGTNCVFGATEDDPEVVMSATVKHDGVRLLAGETYHVPVSIAFLLDDLDAIMSNPVSAPPPSAWIEMARPATVRVFDATEQDPEVVMATTVKHNGVRLIAGQRYGVPMDVWHVLDGLEAIGGPHA